MMIYDLYVYICLYYEISKQNAHILHEVMVVVMVTYPPSRVYPPTRIPSDRDRSKDGSNEAKSHRIHFQNGWCLELKTDCTVL